MSGSSGLTGRAGTLSEAQQKQLAEVAPARRTTEGGPTIRDGIADDDRVDEIQGTLLQRSGSAQRSKRQETSLKARALGGTAWNVAAHGALLLLRVGSNLVLAWLLFPQAFGLMVLVGVVLLGLEMLSDFGIGAAIVQNPRGAERPFLNTAWTIQILRGLGLWLCACILAWPAAWVFSRNDPMAAQIVYLIPVAGVSVLISGFDATSLHTMRRRLELRPLALLTITAQLCGVLVMITVALLSRSVWALVAGRLTVSLVRMCMSHLFAGGIRNRVTWDRDCAKELFVFGRWIILSTAVMFLALQGDRLILGSVVPLDVLGVYGLAFVFASLPSQLFGPLSSNVLFPALSEHGRNSRQTLPQKVRMARRVMLRAATFLMLGIVLLAPAFFDLLYDDRYHAAGFMAQLLAINIWLRILFATSAQSLLSTGNSAALAGGNTVQLAVAIPSCILGLRLFGIAGFILGYALGTVAGLIVIEISMSRAGMSIIDQDIKYSVVLSALAAIGLGAGSASALLLTQTNPVTLQLAAGTLLLALYGSWAGTSIIRILKFG